LKAKKLDGLKANEDTTVAKVAPSGAVVVLTTKETKATLNLYSPPNAGRPVDQGFITRRRFGQSL
jgi:hypothetical protein